MEQEYDIIGDIHGRADELESVLAQCGYVETECGYVHPSGRQAVFLGDFIDRGTENQRVLRIVKAMVENGTAQAIMGNHEFNAICYGTKARSGAGYLRPHTKKHEKQHKEFLDEFPAGSAAHTEMLDWLKTLPVAIDLPEFRVVHACWDDDSFDILSAYLDEQGCFIDDAYQLYGEEIEPIYAAIENVLKSPEYKLPAGVSYEDARGQERSEARIFWWRDKNRPNAERIELRDTQLTDKQKDTINEDRLRDEFMRVAKPTFVGHYYLHGEVEFTEDVAVLDYRDQVTAYRWDKGHKGFDRKNFVMS